VHALFDYIVVGAGAAGSVIAGRLAEDGKSSVLLIEQGPKDLNPLIHVPKGFYFTLKGSRYTSRYQALPVVPGGNPENWTRGKVLGGSSAINGMMWIRGDPADWNTLEELGNEGWNWDVALAAYRAMESHSLGASGWRGADGPLGVSVATAGDVLVESIIDSGVENGWPRVPDVNAVEGDRIGYTPSTIRNGVRTSSYRAFVHHQRHRQNLTVVTRAVVGSLLFDGRRAAGVRASVGGAVKEFRARHEVVLSAGAVESPLLLERSGIGSAEVLREAGIHLRIESPNVGERVIEQRAVSHQVRVRDGLGLNHRMGTLRGRARESLRYLMTRRGPIATGGYDVVAQFRSSPELERPDLQGIWVPMAVGRIGDSKKWQMKLAPFSGALFLGYQIRPHTTGSIHVRSADPGMAPEIRARFLADPRDRSATSKILDIARTIASTAPFADLVVAEDLPGADISTAEEVIDYALTAGPGMYHAVGSCGMGPDNDDVVDARLRVRGVEGLRVADVSVLPLQLAGNTAAPAMTVGWIAADLIKAEWG